MKKRDGRHAVTFLRWLLLSITALLVAFTALSSAMGSGEEAATLVFLLLFGSVPYAMRTLPAVGFNAELTFSGLVSLVLLAIVAHHLLRWFVTARARAQADSAPALWRWRWSLLCSGLFVLFFVASIATIGIVHQTIWLIRGPFRHPTRTPAMKQTLHDIRFIGSAIEGYISDVGYRPHVGGGRIGSLLPMLVPSYIKSLPLTDGWGKPFFYLPRPGDDSYRIVSFGYDGIPMPPLQPPQPPQRAQIGRFKEFPGAFTWPEEGDITYEDGGLGVWPGRVMTYDAAGNVVEVSWE